MRKACLEAVYQLAKADPRVVFMGSDLGAGTLKAFRSEMPERFLMEGISEAHIVGMAAGMGLEGCIVYINTIATFLTRRCFEQIVIDLCLHQTPVRLLGSGGGLVYAPLGPTHEAIEDIAILRAIPGMTILAPADAVEMQALMAKTLDWPGPIYVRIAKGGDAIVTADRTDIVEIGRARTFGEGSDGLLITTGVMLQVCLEAASAARRDGLELSVLHLPTIKPLDVEAIRAAARRSPVVLSVEEHTIVGGLGSAVAEVLAEDVFPQRPLFRRLGLPDAFPEHYGSQADHWRHHDLTPEKVAAAVTELRTLAETRSALT